MNEPTGGRIPYPLPNYIYTSQDDEINLVDIWITLVKFRKVFFLVFSAIMLLGLLSALTVFQEKKSLVTVVQIGTYSQEEKTLPLESPESLLSKINSAIIPEYTNLWMTEKGIDQAFETLASNPKGSEIITITNKVKENEVALFTDYQKKVAGVIIEDHRRLINSFQAKLTSGLELAQIKLKKLENPLELGIKLKSSQIKLEEEQDKLRRLQDDNFFGIKKTEFKNQILAADHELELLKKEGVNLQLQVQRIEENKKIIAKNIGELSQQIKEDRESRKAAQKEVTELSAMSLLMLGNESQQNHNRLLSLEERYYVTLENDKAAVLTKLDANRLGQIDVEKRINILKQKYDQMLVDNQLQVEQQNLVVEKAKLDVEQIKFNHQNAIAQQKQNIREIQIRLDNYNETRIVSPPVASLESSGLTRKALLILVVFMAIFSGFFAMLVAMFADRVRQRRLELVHQDA